MSLICNNDCEIHKRKLQAVSMKQSFFIADAPIGRPKIIPSSLGLYENEKVVLMCNISGLKNGNSPCSTFMWTKGKNFYETFIDTNQLTFLMKEHFQGSYRCKCENEHGMSEESDEAEISFLNSTSLSKITFDVVE